MKYGALMAVVVLFAVGVGGCTPRAHNDAAITASIRQKMTDQHVPGSISITTQRGVVTLTGGVPDERIRERAEGIAEAIGGVQQVVNLLHTTMAGDAPLRPRDVPPPKGAPEEKNPPAQVPPQMVPPGGINIPSAPMPDSLE